MDNFRRTPQKNGDEEMKDIHKKLLELIPKDKELRIIDIGCGKGFNTNLLHEKGFNIEGIDINSNSIKIAKENYPDISFKVKDVFKVDFSEYDVVLAFGLFEYVSNLKILLNKLEKEMKQDSVLIFSIPNVCSFTKRLRCLFGINPNRQKTTEEYSTSTYTFKDIEEMIKPLNFKQKEITSMYYDGIKNITFPTNKNLSSKIIVRMVK